MQNIWLGLNKYHTLTCNTLDSSGNNYTPTGTVYVSIWKVSTTGTYTQVVTSGVAFPYSSAGCYFYNWDITTATGPGDYIIKWTYNPPTGGTTRNILDTAQLINLNFMGTGGSSIGTITFLDQNTGDPKEGMVVWLQLTPTAGDKKSASHLLDSFGYTSFTAADGTYYVWGEGYDVFIGTLVIAGTSPSIFTINPNLNA